MMRKMKKTTAPPSKMTDQFVNDNPQPASSTSHVSEEPPDTSSEMDTAADGQGLQIHCQLHTCPLTETQWKPHPQLLFQ